MRKEIDIILKRKQLQLFVWVVVFSLSSCKGNKRNEDVTKVLLEWIGKEIRFPENVPCYVLGKEALPELCDENFYSEYKILLYVDSAGCSTCRLNLFEWKLLKTEADTLFHGKLGFLFFFQPKSEKEMADLFVQNKFDYPVFMDIYGSINRLNQFPQAVHYQCFLLDIDNKVMALGNPVLNPHVWEFYKSQIAESKESAPVVLTSAEADKEAVKNELPMKVTVAGETME